MKKSLILFCAMLFATASIVARADHGDRGGDDASSGGAPPSQNSSTSPGNDDQGEHGNPEAPQDAAQDERGVVVLGGMVGVDGSFVGSDAIRGLPGAGLPWTVGSARASLRADGRLRIKVRGLVLANDPAVPAAQQGTNPLPMFRGLVSCLSEQSGGGIVTANVMTDAFPATPGGDSDVDGPVALPAQCLANSSS